MQKYNCINQNVTQKSCQNSNFVQVQRTLELTSLIFRHIVEYLKRGMVSHFSKYI